MCGENGSRGRGIRWSRRLIPACAGKTWSRTASGRTPRAHPRVCGENDECQSKGLVGVGSSPRVRGKLRARRHPQRRAGLIPARAGKTSAAGTACRPSGAHPRACGENDVFTAHRSWTSGSSPRVRGKRFAPKDTAYLPWLIPARAGKTGTSPNTSPGTWAHPRACGENADPYDPATWWRGSSPRVRGKREDRRPRSRGPRLIPARAGKTRARAHHVAGGGLIPARAGKTTGSDAVTMSPTAHPRACGENAATGLVEDAETGSSLRMRGKLQGRPHVRRLRGLIPARAGKTRRRRGSRRG